MDNKFAFVILNYCTIEDTIKCVRSIQETVENQEYFIVIVDNASPNGTGKVLENMYKNSSDIHVILNRENLGFARGNNVGFRFAKNNGAEFICMTNSDTYLMDRNFCRQAISDYKNNHYYVLGPNVHSEDESIQSNPMVGERLTYKKTKQKLRSLRCQLVLAHIGLLNIAMKIKRKADSTHKKSGYNRGQYYRDVKLHGCCWIFSPKYIEEYDGINEETFLYLEEDILYITLSARNQLMLYSPNVHIFHSGAASTNFVVKGRQRQIFGIKHHLNSMKVIKNILRREMNVV